MWAGNKSAALEGGLAIAVPLELKGLWMAHQRFGRHAWGSLVAPAATLARNGFPAHPYLINALNDTSVRTKYAFLYWENPPARISQKVSQSAISTSCGNFNATGSWHCPLSELCSSRKMEREDGECQPSMRPAVSGRYLLTSWMRLELRYWLASHGFGVHRGVHWCHKTHVPTLALEATNMGATRGPMPCT